MAQWFFHQKELEKRLDFFKDFRLPYKKNVLGWLVVSVVVFGVALVTMVAIQQKTMQRMYETKERKEEAAEMLVATQENVMALQQRRKTDDALRQKYEKILKHAANKKMTIRLLQALSQMIPTHTWLEEVTIGGVPSAEKKRTFADNEINIKGYAFDEQEIILLHKQLAQYKQFASCSLERFEKVAAKEEGSDRTTLFSFHIHGFLTD